MISTFRSFLHYFGTYPLRGILTLLTIAIGVGALIITFSLSFDVNNALNESLSQNGRRIVIANAQVGDDGQISRQIPPAFDAKVTDALAVDYENLKDVTLVSEIRWDRVLAGDTSYQVRSASAVGARYADLMGFTIVAGTFFTQNDVDTRAAVVVMSESAARILFGSAQDAVGQQVQVAVPQVTASQENGRGRFRMTMQPFNVVGVYKDVTTLERNAFGVADFLLPVGTNLPAGLPISFDPASVVMARLVGDSVDSAEARIRSTLETQYGDDTVIGVWEGSPSGPAPLIEESRNSIRSFTLTINVLGLIILVASSIGIFSIMLVEVLNRMREIGLRRALGSTRAGIRQFFVAQALYFSVTGSVIGVALATVFYRVVGASLAPFFEVSGLSSQELDLSLPGVVPIALAVAAALLMGAVFGLFPAISASRTSIVEAIREDAA